MPSPGLNFIWFGRIFNRYPHGQQASRHRIIWMQEYQCSFKAVWVCISVPTGRRRSTMTAVTPLCDGVAGSFNWTLAWRFGFRDIFWVFFAYKTFARPNWDANSWEERHFPRRSSKNFDLQFANNDRLTDIFKENYSIDGFHHLIPIQWILFSSQSSCISIILPRAWKISPNIATWSRITKYSEASQWH